MHFQGNTVVHGIEYRKLVNTYNWQYALVREDSILHKVYGITYNSTIDTSEQLLYDFSLSIGDTIWNPNVTEKVVAIDSVSINSVMHKVWQYSPVSGSAMGFVGYTIIEGVGCIQTPVFPSNPFPFEDCSKLTCFNNNGFAPLVVPPVNLYFDNLSSCNINLINKVEQPINQLHGITISPNPAMDEMNISSSQTIEILTIKDLLGRTVFESSPQSNSAKVGISSLRSGLYFIDINGCFFSRFIKP
jgi:hypothetical protein